MKQRPRIYYTEAQKALMWDRIARFLYLMEGYSISRPVLSRSAVIFSSSVAPERTRAGSGV